MSRQKRHHINITTSTDFQFEITQTTDLAPRLAQTIQEMDGWKLNNHHQSRIYSNIQQISVPTHQQLNRTQRVNIQLDSSVQGFLRVATKLTWNIQRSNHHKELLQTALITNKLPWGLIPKIAPRIPELPSKLNIKWEDTLKSTAITLTKYLKEY